jgi:predicted MFS family arabinose efflux permease
MWGRASDKLGRRAVLLIGLVGFGGTLFISSFHESLTAIYAERFLTGMFAAAVTPVAAAAIADFATTEQRRARRLAFVSMAGAAGFLLGPMLGVLITRIAAGFFAGNQTVGSIASSLTAAALLAVFAGLAVASAVPDRQGSGRAKPAAGAPMTGAAWVVSKLLVLTFIVSASVGVFEVGLVLRGRQELGLSPYQIGLMFSECSLVMFLVQAIVFSRRVKPDTTRWVIAPMLALLAAALFLVPRAADFPLLFLVVGGVGASAGALSPVLTYWISSKAGSAQGWELGKQTAAASLGVTVGSAAGGLLFKVAALQGASFVLIAGLVMLGLLLSLGLPRALVPRGLGGNGAPNGPTGARP